MISEVKLYRKFITFAFVMGFGGMLIYNILTQNFIICQVCGTIFVLVI